MLGFFMKLKKALDKLKKDSKGAVTTLADTKYASNVPYGISTGSLDLDFALGRPGLPVGRLVEFDVSEGSGKSTLLTHIMISVQKMGDVVVV